MGVGVEEAERLGARPIDTLACYEIERIDASERISGVCGYLCAHTAQVYVIVEGVQNVASALRGEAQQGGAQVALPLPDERITGARFDDRAQGLVLEQRIDRLPRPALAIAAIYERTEAFGREHGAILAV